MLCLPDTSLPQALEIAERICSAMQETVMTYDNREIRVTVSIGLAALRPGDSIELWLSRADQALYEAKGGGRNRCAVVN